MRAADTSGAGALVTAFGCIVRSPTYYAPRYQLSFPRTA